MLRFLFFLLLTGSLEAQTTSGSYSGHVKLRRSLSRKLEKERIRVFYTTEGEHAVALDDMDRDGTPDQVQDVMMQTWAAWQLWTSLGFANPLTTPRFRGCEWLDVHLLNKATLKSNGVTYDEIQRFHREGDPEAAGSLCFDVATSVKAPVNLTPAHEMFHVLQNSVCFFKNRWFTEGTARWSEKALGQGGLPEGLRPVNWPPEAAVLEKVFAGAYETAASYWAPLLAADDPRGMLPEERLPQALLDARYVNGEPVLKDRQLTGWELVRDVLKALDQADDAVFSERKLTRWPEAEQFSPANNDIIHRVVMEVAARRRSGAR